MSVFIDLKTEAAKGVYAPNMLPNESLDDYVDRLDGAVDPETARRYLNARFYGGLEGAENATRDKDMTGWNNPQIGELSLERKLNLYESVVKDDHSTNALYMSALNIEMGFPYEIIELQCRRAERFLKNKGALEEAWKNSHKSEQNFSSITNKIVEDSPLLTLKEKKEYAEFMVGEYSKFIGLQTPKVDFFKHDGSIGAVADPKNNMVYFNTESEWFNQNPSGLIEGGTHEVDHLRQKSLLDKYSAGEISVNHPDYVEARLYAMNFASPTAYLPPDNPLGLQAYSAQTIEVLARSVGGHARRVAKSVYGSNPPRVPITFHRDIGGYIKDVSGQVPYPAGKDFLESRNKLEWGMEYKKPHPPLKIGFTKPASPSLID